MPLLFIFSPIRPQFGRIEWFNYQRNENSQGPFTLTQSKRASVCFWDDEMEASCFPSLSQLYFFFAPVLQIVSHQQRKRFVRLRLAPAKSFLFADSEHFFLPRSPDKNNRKELQEAPLPAAATFHYQSRLHTKL